MLKFANRVQDLQTEGALQVLARAKELEAGGREIIHLEVGEPDFPTPGNICQSAIQAIQNGHTKYTSVRGMPALREAIAERASKRRDNIPLDAQRIVVGPGGKPLLFFPAMAILNPGDEVLYPDPGFPTYREMIKIAGGVPVPVPLYEENNFSFDLNAFDRLINQKTRLIIINTPGSNPTGSVIPPEDLKHIAEAARRYDCWVMSDEMYENIVFDNLQVPSILTLPGMDERTIVVDGFSKTFAMTGWRLGYAIMPKELATRVELLLTHGTGSTAEFTQIAGIEAMTGDQTECRKMVEAFQVRRDRFIAGLNSIPGVHCLSPKAAFYAFPNIKSFGIRSSELSARILNETGVALLPGTAFGQYGEGYLRLSFANSIENLDKAIEKLRQFFKNIK
ncbi:MAG: pyridoxal phosphate-dependent aminotransferase [Chloroflexi bacterium]|nr:pyridoxal phosphate-dependent aminotransferase [Chloroflexota bacterium]